MIAEITNLGMAAVPHGTNSPVANSPAVSRSLADWNIQPIQPVANVAKYLDERRPVLDCANEKNLFVTLPSLLQQEVSALVRACLYVADKVKAGSKVQPACVAALELHKKRGWKLKTFRANYDLWSKTKDWVILVNRSKAPISWREPGKALPNEFLKFCETKLAGYKRSDNKRQVILGLKRQWKTGRDEEGRECPVAGYEVLWDKRDCENYPVGWSYSNITRQIEKRNRYNDATRSLLHDSESAAKEFLPQQLGTRKSLRFLEKITFDDVRMDWLIFNPATGEAEELWVLVARDEATAMVIGFVLLPATVREDNKATHLGAAQMKELAGFILQTYPLPPYTQHWVVERGTATLAEAVKAALAELFNNRIKVHYTSMIGDKSPVGYKEKAKGNSRGKASHEAHNRLFHTQASFIGGQTGANYSIRPADLKARCDEAKDIWLKGSQLPEHLRNEVKYPLPTIAKARELFKKLCIDQNNRVEHNLEDFEDVLEWWDGMKWQPRETAPADARFHKRKEKPIERAYRLACAVTGWERVSPEIVITFLAHTQRLVTLETSNEIKFKINGKSFVFAPPAELPELSRRHGLLAYHMSQEPEFLHVTTGDGRVLGTWSLRGRGAFLDQKAFAEAARYTWAARKAAVDIATELAAPQREALEEMRAHNARCFTAVTEAPTASGQLPGNGVAAGLQSTASVAEGLKDNPAPLTSNDCTEDILKRVPASDPTTENWD